MRRFQQVHRGIGQRAIAVFHLRAHFVNRRFARRAGNLLVEPQPLVLFRHIALVDAQRNAQIELRGRPLFAALALQLLHRGFQHRRVKLEANRLDVPALLAAQHVARAAQLQIERRNLESRAQVAKILSAPPAAAAQSPSTRSPAESAGTHTRADSTGPRVRATGKARSAHAGPRD